MVNTHIGMKKTRTAKAYSHIDFDIICSTNHWDDDNVEELSDKAFISIVGTEECQKYYLEEVEEHWFKRNHPNVLNLEFDDVTHDLEWHGHIFKAMTEQQAREAYEFIQKNLGRDFYVHCRAGVSRSAAISDFITTNYPEMYRARMSELVQHKPNQRVFGLLTICHNTPIENNEQTIENNGQKQDL